MSQKWLKTNLISCISRITIVWTSHLEYFDQVRYSQSIYLYHNLCPLMAFMIQCLSIPVYDTWIANLVQIVYFFVVFTHLSRKQKNWPRANIYRVCHKSHSQVARMLQASCGRSGKNLQQQNSPNLGMTVGEPCTRRTPVMMRCVRHLVTRIIFNIQGWEWCCSYPSRRSLSRDIVE